MPVIKSAIKKLRKDIKRTKKNDDLRRELDKKVSQAKKSKTASAVRDAVSVVDHAVKNNLMHKNRAARIKSSLSKLAKPAAKAKKTTKVEKTTKVKSSAKTTPKKAKKTSK